MSVPRLGNRHLNQILLRGLAIQRVFELGSPELNSDGYLHGRRAAGWRWGRPAGLNVNFQFSRRLNLFRLDFHRRELLRWGGRRFARFRLRCYGDFSWCSPGLIRFLPHSSVVFLIVASPPTPPLRSTPPSAPFVCVGIARFFSSALHTLATRDEPEGQILTGLRRNILKGVVCKIQRFFLGVGIDITVDEHHAVEVVPC